jgi:dienelactone hydrolase
VYPQAVGDVFNACRALRWWLNQTAGTGAELYLHGESFGGGLAVAAAAKITGRADAITHVDRLVLALPTMGDWPWRLRHGARAGMGGQIARLIRERPGIADLIARRLRVADSVVLASRIRCPVLCKLAERDEVVPAPSAAAVFNALAVDPGQKWRFVVPHGHAQTGIANARRHAVFDRVAEAFFDPEADPGETMARHEAEVHAVALADTDEPEREPGLFGDDAGVDAAERRLIDAYQRGGRTLDDLPYTAEFEEIYTTVAKALNANRRAVFHKLHNLRKAGCLPRMGRAAGKAPSIDPMEERWLIVEVVEVVGSLGQRDQLPFTPEFDDLCQRFNAEHARDLTPHDLWRVVAKLAK